MLPLIPGKHYTFSTNAPSILGAEIVNAKLLQTMTYESAIRKENISLKYRQVYPLVKELAPSSPQDEIYYLFKGTAGDETLLAGSWINSNSIHEITKTTVNIHMPDVSEVQLADIRQALNFIGVDYNLEVKAI